MKLIQIMLITLGLFGLGLTHYLFSFRPSLLAVPVSASAAVLLLLFGLTLPSAWLAVYGKQGVAIVSGIECESGKKHHVYYHFLADKKLIKGVGGDGNGNPLCTALHIGDSGVVTYLPGDPDVQVWGLPRISMDERLLACLLALVLVPIISCRGVRKSMEAAS